MFSKTYALVVTLTAALLTIGCVNTDTGNTQTADVAAGAAQTPATGAANELPNTRICELFQFTLQKRDGKYSFEEQPDNADDPIFMAVNDGLVLHEDSDEVLHTFTQNSEASFPEAEEILGDLVTFRRVPPTWRNAFEAVADDYQHLLYTPSSEATPADVDLLMYFDRGDQQAEIPPGAFTGLRRYTDDTGTLQFFWLFARNCPSYT